MSKEDEDVQINASVQHNHAGFLQSRLGAIRYYNFLRDFFEDLSEFNRTGNIAFCKPGIGDLCISWNVQSGFGIQDIRLAFKKGIESINTTRAQTYLKNYSIATFLVLDEYTTNELGQGSFTISMDIRFHEQHVEAIEVE